MKTLHCVRTLILLTPMLGSFLLADSVASQLRLLQRPPPCQRNASAVDTSHRQLDYVRRDLMIPMRDGVKLHTVILVPKAPKRARSLDAHPLRRHCSHQSRA